jgi:hypothetical protein
MDSTILKCENCTEQFIRATKTHNHNLKRGTIHFYCSPRCHDSAKNKRQKVICKMCGQDRIKTLTEIRKTKNNFCSKSCAATFNNLHKKTGTRVSKLEKWIQVKLRTHYPSVSFYFNDKTAISSELDIYIPALKAAIELNGIFHYEPIHGVGKLNQIQLNDTEKLHNCRKKGIDLFTIDTREMTNFKVETATSFLKRIRNIINEKFGAGGWT